MTIEQQITYLDKYYRVLDAEEEFILHPAALDFLPMSKASLQSPFSSSFYIDNYCLMLDKMLWQDELTGSDNSFEPNDFKVSYNGAIMIASDVVKEYYIKSDKLAYFSYQNVLELVFEKGMLVTTIDHSKAMLRIRKNIELRLRSLNNGRDLRCIKRFMNSCFVGDYKPFLIPSMRYKYLKDMKNDYKDEPIVFS